MWQRADGEAGRLSTSFDDGRPVLDCYPCEKVFLLLHWVMMVLLLPKQQPDRVVVRSIHSKNAEMPHGQALLD
jgi:hypothetical protein